MRKRMILSAVACIAGIFAWAGGPDGKWNGRLQINPQVGLNLSINISAAETENPVVTMDSPDQGAYGLPMTIDFLSSDSINISNSQLMMRYSGKIEGEKITGEFSQGMLSLPLEFSLTTESMLPKRPQTPQPPFQYSTEEVTFNGGGEGVTLAGTLTVPSDVSAETPVVVMVTGSGLQNRDEEIFGHKPFAVIADYLAGKGIASLRYDDRGFGDSTGDAATATTADNALDAIAALDYLKSLDKFGKYGLLGHSEGGEIAYMIGSGESAPDFLISIAGPAVRGDSILLFQNRHAMEAGGMPQDIINEFCSATDSVFSYRINNPGITISDDVFEGFYPGWTQKPVYKELAESVERNWKNPSPWMDYFISYSPADDLRNVKAPLLIIYGEKDTQVPPEMNYNAARQNSSAAEIVVMPELNHLMQHAVTGELAEYATIEETISPEVLQIIASFILKNK